MGGKHDVATFAFASAAAIVLVISELPRCHGADKPTYECANVDKKNMVCNVELKVNESLRADCTKAMEKSMPWDGFFILSKGICAPKEPYKFFEQACEVHHEWKDLNKDGIVETTQKQGIPGMFDMTVKNKNKSPPVDFPMISFGCSTIDMSKSAVFNVSFSKEVNSNPTGDPIVPWTSGSWGLMQAQPLVFASAMMTIAFALGLSV